MYMLYTYTFVLMYENLKNSKYEYIEHVKHF
jgi:hypothetical protein